MTLTLEKRDRLCTRKESTNKARYEDEGTSITLHSTAMIPMRNWKARGTAGSLHETFCKEAALMMTF